MSRLDEVIANTAFILDSLMNLRAIYESGCCNNCEYKGRGCEDRCDYEPLPGQLVRYNCPFYERESHEV